MSNTLFDVRINNADTPGDNKLDRYDIQAGVWVTIPAYNDINGDLGPKRGDILRFYWGAVDYREIQLDPNDPNFTLPFYLHVQEWLKPECLKDGTYNVSYHIIDADGNESMSPPFTVVVDNEAQLPLTLVPAAVATDNTYHVINIASSTNGVDVSATDTSISPGDDVTFYWTARDKQTQQILPDGTGSKTIKFDKTTNGKYTIESKYFSFGYEGTLTVQYKSFHPGGGVTLSHPKVVIVDTIAPGK